MDLLESSVSEIEVPPFEGHENFPTQPPKLESSTPKAAVSILNGWWTSEPKKNYDATPCPEILPMLSKHVHFNLHIPWIEHRHYCTSSFYSPRSPPSQSRNQSDLSCFWWLDMLMRYHWDRMVLSKNKPYSSPEPSSLPHSNSTQMYLQTALWWNHFLHRLPQHWLCLVRNKHQYHPARILFPHIPGEWRSPQPPELPSQWPWHRRWGLLWAFCETGTWATYGLNQNMVRCDPWLVCKYKIPIYLTCTNQSKMQHTKNIRRCGEETGSSGDVMKKLVIAPNELIFLTSFFQGPFSIPRIRQKRTARTAPISSHLRLGLSCAKCFNPPKPWVFSPWFGWSFGNSPEQPPWIEVSHDWWLFANLLGWFQPSNFRSNWKSSPRFGVEIFKIWNHQLVYNTCGSATTMTRTTYSLHFFWVWRFKHVRQKLVSAFNLLGGEVIGCHQKREGFESWSQNFWPKMEDILACQPPI